MPFSPLPRGEVLADLPVEGRLQRVLDRQRAALDEEQVVARGVGGTASVEKVSTNAGEVLGVDVAVGGLVRAASMSASRNSGSAIFGWL